jgi:hypothetical protein
MAPEQHQSGEALTTASSGRHGVFWALLAALLIVMGLGAPGPASARPAAEYGSVRILAAAESVGVARAAPVRATAVASAAAVLRPEDQAPTPAASRPNHDYTASRDSRGLVRHDYQAIGPPGTGLSQPD